MVTRKAKRSLIATVTFAILPLLVIIKSSGTLFGSGPEIARALYNRLPFIVPDADDKDEMEMTEQQRDAFSHIEILKAQKFGPSPLHRMVETNSNDKNPPPPTVSHSLQVTVQMIMTSSAGNTVLIDSKAYKVGQMLTDSFWIIRNIDGKNRSVTLENTQTGKSKVLQVQTPG